MKRTALLIILMLSFYWPSSAQDDLLSILEETDTLQLDGPVSAIFKSTRIINGHSVELRKKHVLDFIISHRFGRINGGAYEFFGLDEANVRLGLDYGLSDKMNIGIGRNSFEKTFDSFIKYELLKQSSKTPGAPVSAVIFTSVALNSLRRLDEELPFSSRLTYTWQLLIARKFTPDFSLQITPTFIHKNIVKEVRQKNDSYALGIGGRHRITKRVSINAEYFIVSTLLINHLILIQYLLVLILKQEVMYSSFIFQTQER